MPLPDVFSFIRPNHPTVIHKAFIDRKRDRVNVEWAAGWDGDPDEPHYGYSVDMWKSCSISDAEWWIERGSWKVLDPAPESITVENTGTGAIHRLTKVNECYVVESLNKRLTIGMYDVNLVQRFINSGIWKVIEGV